MILEEFESRTGFYPTLAHYSFIEKAYLDSNLDKDAFCWIYKKNEDGIADAIARKASNAAFIESDKAEKDAAKKISELEKEVERLTAQLEREQEWKSYEFNGNVKQEDYAKLAEGAADGKCSHYMTDEEAIQWICDEFDFDPLKVIILHEVDEYEVNRHNQLRRTGRKIDRRPVYSATDYHYIRFNTSRWYYECWNDSLRPFFD